MTHTNEFDDQFLVHNRTPREIVLEAGEGRRLHLSPLGQRLMCKKSIQPFENELWVLRRRHDVSVRPYPRQPGNHQIPVMMAIGILMVLGAVGYRIWDRTGSDLVVWATGVFGVVLVLWALVEAFRAEQVRIQRERRADVSEGDVDFGAGGEFYSGNELGRIARKYGVLFVVVILGVLLPAVAIVFATDTKTFFEVEDGFLRVVPGSESQLVARLIQMTYVAILAIFPALMYFQFDRQRAGTIRGQWVRSIFRIDGRTRNLSDINARYGDLMSEASNYRSDASRALGGKHSPLIVATILLALGWVILVARTESFDFDRTTQATAQTTVAETAAMRAEELADQAGSADDPEEVRRAAVSAVEASETARMAAEQSGAAEGGTGGDTAASAAVPPASEVAIESLTVEEARDLANRAAAEADAAAESAGGSETEAASTGTFQMLTPSPGPAGMAFLGAYFFAIYLVLKAYLRGDLRPKVYNQITARLVTVVVVAYLISVLIPADDPVVVQSLAFVAGVIPNTVLRRLGELTAGTPLVSSLFGQAFGEDRPLTLIDGVDVYERERLASEGISDIEALAHTEIVANMVNTRIPMERLIDWVDQAVLLLHLDDQAEGPESPAITLRRHGVRTGSAFIHASRCDSCQALQNTMEQILGVEDLEPMARVLDDELVMRQIKQWNESPLGKPGAPPRVITVGRSTPGIDVRLEPAELGTLQPV